jgi:Na+/H+ antiporter NhaD/arsenite permease-like protein
MRASRRPRTALILTVFSLLVFSVTSPAPALAADDPGAGSPHGEEAAQHEPAAAEHGEHGEHGGHGDGPHLGSKLPLWSVLPFAGILLSIAVFPLAAPHFWHRHYPKVSAAWAILFAVPFLVAYGSAAFHEIVHIYLVDYIPFIILLWGLFTVSGGIVLRGTLRGTPAVNTILLLCGTALASWIGTTGAAMVMIRPILRANAHRKYKTHIIVFFIFLVANIGGSLTPLGDPPLFLGFLHGVPFFWTLGLIKEMAFVCVILLVLFYFLDRYRAARDVAPPDDGERQPLRLHGWHNFFFLGGILLFVLLSGLWDAGSISILGVHEKIQNLVRNGGIVLMGLVSLWTTRRELRRENEFTWGPILEVAYLFAGIFMTIIPALAILRAGQSGALAGLIRAVQEPWHYFWVTGGLSAFLDNAPTYLTFFSTALGRFYPGVPEAVAVERLIAEHNLYLVAIAIGAVFMGAATYIGNAPNFMVKSIAEEAGIPMPSFFGFVVRWTVPVLVPIFVLVTFVFLI